MFAGSKFSSQFIYRKVDPMKRVAGFDTNALRGYFLGILFVISGLLLLNGCKKDDDSTTGPSMPASSQVMVAHASPDAPAVDLLVDNSVVGTNLSYPNNTGYLTVTAGAHNVKVRVTGTTTTVIDANITLGANTTYSVFAADSASRLTPVVLTDNLSAPASGKAHVRFVHLSPNAPAVDVALQGGAVLFANKTFKQYTDFTPLDAGTYNLEVRLAGTNTVVLPLPNVTIQAGKIYTVFAKGFVGGTAAQALGAHVIVNK